MAEADGFRIAAVLAADADFQFRPCLAPSLDAQLHELSNARHIDGDEGVTLDKPLRQIIAQEASRVVARNAKRRLREIVGPEAEEFGALRDLIGQKCRAGQLDHGADEKLGRPPPLVRDLFGNGGYASLQEIKLALEADERHHDLEAHFLAVFLLGIERRFHDRARLHLVDLGIGDPEAASAMTEHRVRLGERDRAGAQFRRVRARGFGDFDDLFVVVRNEFVQRRIEEPDRHRQSGHDAEDLVKIAALHGEELRKRRFAARQIVGQNHLAHRQDPFGIEEHVLGAAEADAFGAEAPRGLAVRGRVGVGPYAETAFRIGPFHDRREIAGKLRQQHRHAAAIDFARGAVDGDDLATSYRRRAGRHGPLDGVDFEHACARHAGPAHAARDDGSVAGHAAADGKDAPRSMHTVDVFGTRLKAYQDHGASRSRRTFGFLRREHDFARGRAG